MLDENDLVVEERNNVLMASEMIMNYGYDFEELILEETDQFLGLSMTEDGLYRDIYNIMPQIHGYDF